MHLETLLEVSLMNASLLLQGLLELTSSGELAESIYSICLLKQIPLQFVGPSFCNKAIGIAV